MPLALCQYDDTAGQYLLFSRYPFRSEIAASISSDDQSETLDAYVVGSVTVITTLE